MIGIFDSGIGGLSVLKEVRKALPGADLVYYADNAHCPYGPKSREFVQARAEAITETLAGEYGADIIVIACNTATAASIAYLRKKYSEPSEEGRRHILELTHGRHDHLQFIGMEPAVKPASQMTRTGVIGVLATAGTLRGQKYADIREQYAQDVRIMEHIGEGFVEMVEKGKTEGPEAEAVVSRSLKPMLDAGADTIVLGCTHYPFLEKTIRKVALDLGHPVTIINPAPAVTRHLAYVMAAEGIPSKDRANGAGQIILLSSGDGAGLKRAFANLLQSIQ